MKITKTRLKEIIREELSTVRESEPPEPGLPAWEGEPFGEYDLEAENEKGRLAAAEALGVDPADPSLWQKILAAVEKANIFPRTEGLGEPGDTPPRDRFGADDDGYPPERPPPRSWVDGKPPKPPAKKVK